MKIIGLFLTSLVLFAACSAPSQSENRAANTNSVDSAKGNSSASKRPAPTGLTGVPDPADPGHKINLSWTRNASDNADVEVFVDDKFVANVGSPDKTTYQLTGLAPGKTYKIKIWNFWKQQDVSDFSNEITVTTAAAAAAAQ